MRITTPENITSLKDNEIFVFGSNLNGNHAGGAALQAKQFGAQDGIGEGLTGQTYAFPTLTKQMKKVTLKSLKENKERLYKTAQENPDKVFLVTKLGCGIAGFKESQMKKIFEGEVPDNVMLPIGWTKIVGYKAMNEDMTCRGFQYELGKTYTEEKASLCTQGFHFCSSVGAVYEFYPAEDKTVVCEVEALGEVVSDDQKSVTTKMKIVRMLRGYERKGNSNDSNSGYRNSGDRNSGYRNSGDWNSGDRNSGYRNSGDWNSGDRNSGDRNSGYRNSGDWNSGDWNSGDSNSGYRNSGDRNSGDRNSGDWNSGDSNSGYWNSGDRNSGDRNSGDWNSGDWNSGDSNSGYWNSGDRNSGDSNSGHRNSGHRNSGHRNSGDWNSGDWNSGYWNSGNSNSGFFNSITPEDILVFNKKCKREVWENAHKPSFLSFDLTEWVYFENMTDLEKEEHKEATTTGGYLKKLDYKEAFQKAYANASEEDKKALLKLPNFDKKVFYEISGIQV